MARRRRRKRVRRQAGIKILNILESYTYASILSNGIMGADPLTVITDPANIESYSATDRGWLMAGRRNSWAMEPQSLRAGSQVVSLGDIITKPGDSLAVMVGNTKNSLLPMAAMSITTGIAFRLGRRLLRKPIANVNRNIMKPIFGGGASGVKL